MESVSQASSYYFVSDPAGQALIYLITGLVALGAGLVSYYLWRYHVSERLAYRRLKQNLRHVSASENLETIHQVLKEGVRETLVAERLDALLGIRLAGATVEQDQLAAITADRERTRLGVLTVVFITRILILLGLLGTFVGLTTVVLQFDVLLREIDTTTTEALLESVASTTSGLGATSEGLVTAFASSVWGLVGTLVLSLGVLLLEHAQEDTLCNLEGVTASELIPFFSPPEVADAVRDSARRLTDSAREIRKSIKELDVSAQRTLEGVRALAILVQQFRGAVREFSDSGKLIHEAQRQVRELLAELLPVVAAADEREAGFFERLDAMLAQSASQGQHLAQLLRMLQQSESLGEEFLTKAFSGLASERESLLGALRDSQTQAEQRSKGIFDAHRQALEGIATSVDRSCSRFERRFNAAVDSIRTAATGSSRVRRVQRSPEQPALTQSQPGIWSRILRFLRANR